MEGGEFYVKGTKLGVGEIYIKTPSGVNSEKCKESSLRKTQGMPMLAGWQTWQRYVQIYRIFQRVIVCSGTGVSRLI